MIFTYRLYAERGALNLNECCILPVKDRGWMLHFYGRATDGHEQTYRVPVNPGGPHIENGPLGRTWGLIRGERPGEWQITPSIDFGDWHHTPKIVDVPDDEPWVPR